MKKLLISTLCALILTGCDKPTQEQKDADIAAHITEFSYKGHRYIMYERSVALKDYSRGYAGISHDPDCPCREKGVSYEY